MGIRLKDKSPKWILGLFIVLLGMMPGGISGQSISVTSVTTTPVCAGSDVSIKFDVTNGSASSEYFTTSTNYQIYLSDGSGSNFQASGATFQVSGTYDATNGGKTSGLTTTFTIPANKTTGSGYKISIGSTSPTFNASLGAGASAAFTVNALITPTVTITPSVSGAVCDQTTVQFKASTSDGGASATFQWQYDGITIAGENQSTYSRKLTASENGHKVRVVMTPSVGCTAGGPFYTDYIIAVNALPATPSPTTNSAICAGGTINLSTQTVAGASYAWSGPNGFTSALQNPTIPNATAAMAGVYNVIVTSSANCASAQGSTPAVVVNALPATPSPTTNSPICAGGTINLSTQTVAGASYAWSGPNGFTSALQNPTIPNATAAMAGVYNVIVTSSANCASAQGSTPAVVVNALPATPSPTTNSPICAGGTINLSTQTVAGASYAWSGPNGFTSALQNPTIPNATAAMAGVYNVIVTSSANCASAQGSTPAVVVNALPATPSPTTNSPICAGGTINLSTQTVAGASYAWSGPNGFTSALQNPTIPNATAAMAGVYNVIVTSSANCASAQGSTPAVVVNALPATPSPTTNSPICAGGTINLSTQTVAGASYAWSGPNGFTSALQNPTIPNATAAMAGVYNVIVTSSANCASAQGSTPAVVVNALPATPSPTTNSPICAGGTINLSTQTVAGASYAWSGPNGFTSALQNPTIPNATAAMAGVYNVIVTSSANCASAQGSTPAVVVNALPATPSPTTNSPICAGGTINLSTQTVAGASYAWSGPNGFTSALQNPTIPNATAAMAGVYNVIVTSSANCASAQGSTPAVVVNALPATPSPTTNSPICAGGTINLSTQTVAGASYAWSGPNGFTSALQNPTIPNATAAMAGVYNVIVTSSSNCASAQGSTPAVVVNALVTPSVTITSTSTNICTTTPAGSTPVAFSIASSNNVGGNPTYQWKLNGNPIAGATSSTYSANGLPSGSQISLAITSNATCPSPVTVNSTNTITLTGFTPPSLPVFNPTPSQTNSVNATLLCPPESGLPYAVTSSANIVNYNWTVPAAWGNISNGQGTNNITLNETNLSQGNFNIQVSAQNACGSNTATLQITVDKSASVYAGANASICQGDSYSLHDAAISGYINASGNGALVWTATPNSGHFSNDGIVNPIFYPNSDYSGDITLTLTSTKRPQTNNCNTLSNSMTLTVNAPPAITVQPSATNKTYCLNDAATQLSVTATGAGVSYQWYSNTTTTNSGGTAIGGATSSTYTPSTATAGSLYYYVVVSGTCTPAVSSSVSGKITVNALPAITTQPSNAAQTICLGDAAAQLSVTATGAGVTYQWYSNTTNSNSGGTLISGATSSTYTPSTATAGSLYYYVVVSGTCTPAVSSSVSGKVTVNALPAITTQPSNAAQTICLGDAAAQLSVTATGAGVTYQWYSNTTNSNSGGTLISGATSSTYTPSTATAGSLYYYVVVSGTCTPAVSSSVSGKITVNALPAITTQPSNAAQTICLGDAAAQLSVTATGAGVTYQWYSNTTNSNSGGTLISGATSSTYTPSTATAGSLYYYVVVSGTCTPAVSSSVSGKVTVNALPAITTQPSNAAQTICLGDAAAQLSVTATGAGVTYQWYSNTTNSNSGGTLISGATSSTYTPSTATAGSLYYYVVVSGTCTPAVSSSVSGKITVNALPAITTQPSNAAQTICLGDAAAQLSVTATGAGVTYQWYSNTTNSNSGGTLISGATSSTYTPSTATAGSLYYYVVVSGTCTPAVSSSVSGKVTVNALPAITTQPSNAAQTICLGDAAAQLSVTATGAGVTYQWYSNTTNSNSGGTLISGATSSTYTPSTATAGSLYYYVVVSGTCTPPVSSSVSGAINVSPLPTAAAGGNQTICSDGSYTLTAGEATSSNGTMLWTSNGGGTITNETTLTPTYQPVAADAGKTVTLTMTVTGTSTCSSKTATATYSIIVNQPVSITTQPKDATVCASFSASFTVAATGTGLTYQWNKGGTPIPGATSATYTISHAALADAGSYTVTVSGATGCNSMTSDPATLAVNQLISITQPASVEVCDNAPSVSFGITANGTNPTYVWRKAGIPIDDGGNISGTKTATLMITNPQSGDGGSYDVVVSVEGTGCNQIISNPAVLSVDPLSVGGTVSADQYICTGTIPGNITLSNNVGTVVKWQSSSDPGFSSPTDIAVASTTLPGSTIGAITTTTYFRAVVKSGSCNTDNSTTATVIVNPTPDVNAITNQTVCAESTTTAISFSGTVNGTVYNWSNNTTSIGLAATGNSDISSFTAKNPGTTPLTATVTVTPSYTNGGATCTGTSRDFTITVNPAATVNHVDDQTVCNNVNTADINFQSNQTGGTITYAWTNDNASIGLAGSGTGNIASFTGTNAGNDPAVANISVIPTYLNNSVSCPGPSNSFKITVNPTPAITNTFDNPIYCNGDNTAAGVTFTSNVTGATFSWTSSVDVGFGTSGNGNISSFTATNTTSAPVTTTVTVTPAANGCPGTSSTFTITVNPTATITNNFADPIAYTYCNNTTGAAIDFTSDVLGATYAWTCSTDIGFGTSGTDNISSFTATNSTNAPVTATITVTPTANGCAGTSKTFKITVNPTPTISNTLNNVVYCNGASGSGISFTGPVSGETFSWTSSSNVGFGASGNGNIPTFTATNTSNVPVTATVTVTASANSCSNSSYNFTVTVNPTATITNTFSNPVYCNGSSGSGVSFSSNVSGATFSWTSSKDVGFGASGTGNIGAFTATNSTNVPVTTTVTVTPLANGCTGTSKTFTITINPTTSIVTNPTGGTYCQNSTASALTVSATGTGTLSYQWYTNTTSSNIGGTAISGVNTSSYTPPTTAAGTIYYYVVVTGTCGSSSSNPVAVNVDATPVGGTLAISSLIQLNIPGHAV